jgi:hypothetical protein
MAGTQAVLANERPERTLRQVFDEVFYPSLHLDPQAVRGPLRTSTCGAFQSCAFIPNPWPRLPS